MTPRAFSHSIFTLLLRRSLPSLKTLISAMAAPADPTAAAVLDPSPINGEDSPASDDLKFGFQRPEMNESPLAGTVGLYDCHLFLCYKNPESWPSRVEGHDADLLPRFLAAALKSRKGDIPRNVLLTVCEGREDSEFLDGDVLIFPDMIKYRGLTHSEVDNFVEEVLVCGKQWLSGREALLVGSHIFVCSHGSRDKRCGVCGPVLIKKLEEEIGLRGLKDRVFVCPCSHVGGHKYAGNLIIFSSNHEGEVMGHWYGYVTPDDVSALLDQHIEKGEIIDRLWRGQMGMSDEEQKKVHEHRLQQNGEEVQTNGIDTIGSEKLLQEDNSKVSKSKDVASCCQGANGFSCCMEQKVEDKEAGAGSLDKPSQSKTYLDGINTWMKRLDQGDALVALGVIGVVTSVAVAYSVYRRSG